MKTIEAEVVQHDKAFRAKVVVLDEGMRYTGVAGLGGQYENPSEVLHAALADACKQITDKLHAAVNIKTEVTF